MLTTTYLDEGAGGWVAGMYDVTREDKGTIDPLKLLGYPGQWREERFFRRCHSGRMSEAEWSAFKANLSQNGMEWPIMVFVEITGKIVISEGNHRLRAAVELGWSEVPVEIRYFGNSQREFEVK